MIPNFYEKFPRACFILGPHQYCVTKIQTEFEDKKKYDERMVI
jgi:hypothetical protein